MKGREIFLTIWKKVPQEGPDPRRKKKINIMKEK